MQYSENTIKIIVMKNKIKTQLDYGISSVVLIVSDLWEKES